MGKTHTRSVRLKPSPPSLKLEAGAVNICDSTLLGCTGLEVCLQSQVSNKLHKRSSELDSGKQANVSPTKIKHNAVETLLEKFQVQKQKTFRWKTGLYSLIFVWQKFFLSFSNKGVIIALQ